MDVCESKQALRKDRTVESPRKPLVPAERNNAVTPRRSGTREVSSRYKSPSPATSSSPRRYPSPNPIRTTPKVSDLVPKRATSAERKRPSTPPSPRSPSTPVRVTSVNTQLLSRKIASSRLQESLWPSTMRSLSVSFQSDAISIPVSKKVEKPLTSVTSERTLRPSSNVVRKQIETPKGVRKPTPERKISPLTGKNSSDHSENSKPTESLHTRLIDQHRWPSRTGGKVSLNKSVDITDKTTRALNTPGPGIGVSSLRRLSSDGITKPLQKSASDAMSLLSVDEIVRAGLKSVDDNQLQLLRPLRLAPVSPSSRSLANAAARSQSVPSPVSRPPSPSKSSILSPSRGASPSRSRPSTPSRAVSPLRIRSTCSSSNQSNSPNSVLTFIADVKGKKGANYIEDAHQLRLMYNRYLQWRFANSRAEAVLDVNKETVEGTLYNVWYTILCLWNSIVRKRISLQQLNLDLKLNAVLKEQIPYLDDWSLLEMDHIEALSRAIKDLEASTLRLPVTGGSRADIDSIKTAICSAVHIMQAIGSSIYSSLLRVDGVNNLVSDLAIIASKEKNFLDECEVLLASTTAMQVEEYSLRTHLMQFEQSLRMRV